MAAWRQAAVVAVGTAVLVGGAGSVSAGSDQAAAEDVETFHFRGLCDGGAGYAATATERRDTLELEVTVRGAGARTRWHLSEQVDTEQADGSGVTMNADGASTRADRRGSLRLTSSSGPGASHCIEVMLGRADGRMGCVVVVRR